MTSVAPFKGQERVVSDLLKASIGIALPKPNRTTSRGDARSIWLGPGQALVMSDVVPDLDGAAAITDQSDAWATIEVSGSDVVDVLARLVPIDLRLTTFKVGHTARTMLGHMTASVTRTGKDRIEVMVMRSMAETLLHDLRQAAEGWAARP